jgi:hypothetical protein
MAKENRTYVQQTGIKLSFLDKRRSLMAVMNKFVKVLQGNRPSRGLVWGMLIISALLAFEIFNYSTTDFAMTDLLGDLRFAGIRWATILAIAFCGIDFAGIARLFTPEEGADEPKEVWYLFGAWLLAATMNALLTWWGVSIAILNHNTLGNAVIPRETLVRTVPVFVAVIVWLIRVLIIGTFSVAGERLFTEDKTNVRRKKMSRKTAARPRTAAGLNPAPSARKASSSYRPAPRRSTRSEPTYHPVSMKSHSEDYHEYGD